MDSQFVLCSAKKEDCKTLTEIFKKTFPFYADPDIYDEQKLFERIQTGDVFLIILSGQKEKSKKIKERD